MEYLIRVSKDCDNELNKMGKITYKSKVTNIVGVETDLTELELLKIDGVISADHPAQGRLYGLKLERATSDRLKTEYIKEFGGTT